MALANLLDTPIDGLVNIFLTIGFVNDAPNTPMCIVHFGFVRFSQQEPVATLGDSCWAIFFVVCAKNGTSRDRGCPMCS